MLDKKLAYQLTKIEGEARGASFKTDAEYVLKLKGTQGLKKVEQKLEELGVPLKYSKIKTMNFYPLGWRAISLLAIKESLDWSDKEIKDLCGFGSRVSLIVRLYMKFFYSIAKITKIAPKIWRDYFSKGEFVVKKYDMEKKYAIFQLKDFELHPIYCRCFDGFLERIVGMIVNSKEIKSQETKCVFKGDKEHEFLVKWK